MVQDESNGMEPTAFEETFSAKFRSFDRNMIPFYKHRWAGVAILELSSSFKHELIDELKSSAEGGVPGFICAGEGELERPWNRALKCPEARGNNWSRW